MSRHKLAHGRGAGNRHNHPDHPQGAPLHGAQPADADHPSQTGQHRSHAAGSPLPVQAKKFIAPHFPFQPLPTPLGTAPFRFDLGQLLAAEEVSQITQSGVLVFHCVGDTGDERGRQMDFVAAMMTQDYDNSPAGQVPAFFYHLGDVVYFAGDIDMYGENFYETYAGYPGLIVAIAGNHDCQPDDPQDGPVDPDKKPLDGWVQNFMSATPTRLGSLKTNSSRTQMDLPNVYWTFTTPFATIIGLFSNVSETEAEIHRDQLDWFKGELRAADPGKALIIAIHHPPFSGDTEHSGSTAAEHYLFESFAETGVYPHLILSGHVHNYQRFTVNQAAGGKTCQIACVVAGNGGYTNLGPLAKIHGAAPEAPLRLTDSLSLQYFDDTNFGFVRFAVTPTTLTGTFYAAPYDAGFTTPTGTAGDSFKINLQNRTISSP